jgi:hypothetical protein
MISRLTTLAVVFAVMATSTIAYATHSVRADRAEQRAMPVVQLEPVVIHVKRSTVAPR